MIKTKIIATIGPACNNQETISAMIDNGVDVFRLNFSHGTLDDHAELLKTLNAARAGHLHTTAVMGDLCGPKIRVGIIEPQGQALAEGDQIRIIAGTAAGNAECFTTNYEFFIKDVQVNHRVFLDDGNIELRIIDKTDEQVVCKVIVGGRLYSNKGINLPDSQVSTDSITKRDWECVDWAIENGLDFLALSFVRTAEEIKRLKDYLNKASADMKIVAKIEKPQALEHLEEIIRVADIVLVARGDLGVEMNLAQVPLIQKQITRICMDMGKPVVIATQMLQSMIEKPTPTRAEVSDVANAIMDLTDAVMLSGETAVGKYPLKAVKTIQQIAKVTEEYLDRSAHAGPKIATTDELVLTAAIARSVAQIVDDTGAKLVAVWSQTGSATRLLSKARIDVPILAISSEHSACRRMCLHYGVIPRSHQLPEDVNQFAAIADELILTRNWAKVGDKIVVVAGQPIGQAGATNSVMVHTISK
jgi:pyruvate kinase